MAHVSPIDMNIYEKLNREIFSLHFFTVWFLREDYANGVSIYASTASNLKWKTD